MEDIINQIVQIDSGALSTRQKNEEALRQKQAQYEEKMKIYREDALAKAKSRADEVYQQIVETGMKQTQIEEEKSKQIALLMENRYLQVENLLLDKLFNELFARGE